MLFIVSGLHATASKLINTHQITQIIALKNEPR